MIERRASPAGITPSQTVGPFFAYALTPGSTYAFATLAGDDLVTADTVGEPVVIMGQVFDGEGKPVPDALIEIWQADGSGRYPGGASGANTSFKGFGRSETKDGYRFRTVRPGAVARPDGKPQAPHIAVGVFARGILRRMLTRIYFDGELANATDPVLMIVSAERRATLIARRSGTEDGAPRYAFDIHLQGDEETVFFEA